jgi:hypothetical protein
MRTFNKVWGKTLCGASAALLLLGASINSHATIALIAGTHTVDTVTPITGGTWQYQYQLFNDSYSSVGALPSYVSMNLNNWNLPWFTLGGILPRSILSPSGWGYSIETIGIANSSTGWSGVAAWPTPFNTVTQVLHWYDTTGTAPISDLSSLSGFGYTALYAPTYAPYQAVFSVYNGLSTSTLAINADPAYPNSPYVFGLTIPEPGILALLLLGLGGLAFVYNFRPEDARQVQN